MKTSDMCLTIVTTCLMIGAGIALCSLGYSYASVTYECVQLEEALEQCEAEKALLEALLEQNSNTTFTIGTGNQGWISPIATEN
jgi:hypothetical protein